MEVDAVKIGKEKLRLENLLQTQIETQKKLRYDLSSADNAMQRTTRLLNELQSFPDDYFKDYATELANLDHA